MRYSVVSYPIQFVIRKHNEELVRDPAVRALRYEHMMRPSASTEIEASQVLLPRVVGLS